MSRRIPNRALVGVCRNLASLLSAGVPVLKALSTAARNAGDPRARRALEAVALDIRKGEDLSAAFDREAFPPLAVEMVRVAEETGQLPEILRHLAAHYENLVTMRRIFLAAIAWPAFQLFAAIFVIAVMILALGWVAESRGGEPVDVLGFGLTGPKGAMIWLAITLGTVAAAVVASRVVATSDAAKRVLDPLVMRVPVIGRCVRSFALARFSWALALTQQTGMNLDRCLDVSLRATSNGAFIGEIPRVTTMIRTGEELAESLRATALFPETYLQTVEVADSSGTVPETLERISPELEGDARRSLAALVAVAGWLIWVLVAVFIIVLIFRLASFYVGMINEAAKGL